MFVYLVRRKLENERNLNDLRGTSHRDHFAKSNDVHGLERSKGYSTFLILLAHGRHLCKRCSHGHAGFCPYNDLLTAARLLPCGLPSGPWRSPLENVSVATHNGASLV